MATVLQIVDGGDSEATAVPQALPLTTTLPTDFGNRAQSNHKVKRGGLALRALARQINLNSRTLHHRLGAPYS